MNSTFGNLGVTLAVTASLAGFVTSAVGLLRRRPQLVRFGPVFARMVLVGAIIAVIAMERAIITRDFSLAYVAKVGSTKTRLTSAPADGVYEATIANNTRNAFALYQQLKKPGENLFYSPHSAQMALAILYAGASGENAKAFEPESIKPNGEDSRIGEVAG